MGPKGMEVAQSSEQIINEQIPAAAADAATAATSTTTETGNGVASAAATAPPFSSPSDLLAGYSTSDILAAVSDSAEEGIALLTNWFGLATTEAPDVSGVAASNDSVAVGGDDATESESSA